MIFCLFVQLDKFLYQNNYKYDINFTKPFSNKNIVKNKKKNENCNIIIIAYYIIRNDILGYTCFIQQEMIS